jgi:transcriptional regulator with XRE-family HTH domain
MLAFSGPALRKARESAGRHAEEIALAIGRSTYSVHQYERGSNLPTIPVLCRLAAELGIPVGALFEEGAADGQRGAA